MNKLKVILLNLIFCLQVLITFLLLAGDKIKLPLWLQVAGRLHPLLLHLPIGLAIFFFILILIPKRNYFHQQTLDVITFLVLLLTSLLASLTALFGIMLSLQGDYGSDSLTQHKISSVVLSWLLYLFILNYDWLKERRTIFYGVNVFVFALLFFAGHTGSTLTHGENFVFEPLLKEKKESLSKENSSVFQLVVQPVLEKKCFSCHNESKAKGGLVMTSIASFKKGGKHGKEWEEGKPDQSNLIKVIHLPLTHDQHMPPDGKAQLSKMEIDILKFWIQSGANFDINLSALAPNDSLRIIASSVNISKLTTEERIFTFAAASKGVVDKLNSPFRSVFPLYQNSPALRADFFVAASFDVKALEELSEVEEQLVELNLSRMPVTDKELDIVARFKNLEKLNLNFTKVKSDLTPLKKLKHLKSLSLSGTEVNSEAINHVLLLPDLKELFVWNTGVVQADQVKLSNQHKNILITWNIFNDDMPIKLSSPMIVNDGVLKKNEAVILKHVMQGVTIRYTLDGSTPDSLTSEIYKAPIPLPGATQLKARAFKEGWLGSDVFETMCYVEGIKANQMELLSKPDPSYLGEGSKSLMDGRRGTAELFREPSWLGYRDNSFMASFDFGKEAPAIKNIVISYGRNTGSYIFPPEEVQVWVGDNDKDARLLKTIKVPQPTANETAKVDALIIPVTNTKSYYKLIAKPVAKLPSWHSGKGQKGWFFVDEIFFN
ncbi:MAG TPA: peptidylprolyl isomerase [Cytophagales bacterium]|jgi:hypothetical protein|nr:peptidylprolyl isomerase [Cytophagales bacterium]